MHSSCDRCIKKSQSGTRRTRRSPRANLEVVKLRDKDKRSSYRLRMNIAGTWLALNPENTSTCMADFQTLKKKTAHTQKKDRPASTLQA